MSNKTDPLTIIFRHNLWANQRLFEICADLETEQLNASIAGAFGSIRETLRHIVLAEQSYFARISTGQPSQPSDKELTLSEMLDSVRKTGRGLIEWAFKVKADDMVILDWRGTPREVPKSVILTQVINHATEHRAQIMAILTNLGIQPPNLDSWSYFDETDK